MISGDLWAGAEVQVYTLLRVLKDMPALKIFAIVLNEGKLSRELKTIGIETTVIEENQTGFFEIYRLAKEWLRDKDIDLLHTHRYKENILGALLKRAGMTRHLIQTIHGSSEPFRGIRYFKSILTGALNAIATNHYFDRVITVSQDLKERLGQKIKNGEFVTIHNSVDISSIAPTKPSDKIRNELGIRSGQPVIGTAGRMVPIKGFDILLSAAQKFLKERPEAIFIIAGDGPLKSRLERQAKELGIAENVKFLGFRDDIVDVINCLDIFVISSYHEGIPTAVLEAMSLNKVVVSTAVGGINEIITDGISGVLVNPADPSALAGACLKVLRDKTLGDNLRIQAKQRVEEEFSAELQAARTLEVYKEIV